MLLDEYIRSATLRACVLVAAALTALFSLFAFVDQLASVGQAHYTLRDAAIFVTLTAPYRLLQVTPISMLLGCLLALGGFGRHGELAAMRSLGVSERRILTAAIKLAGPVMIVLFLLAEFVIPPSQRLAQEGRTSALSTVSTARGDDSFWAEGAHSYLNVQRFEDGNVPADVDIFAFDGGGDLLSFLHAQRARIEADGHWTLSGVTRKVVRGAQFTTERFASLPWHSFMTAEQTELLILPPADMPPVALYRYARYLERNHLPSRPYEVEVWGKVGLAVSIVAMMMIAAPFVFGPPRSRTGGLSVAIGAGIGIAFTLFQQVVSRLDLVLDLDPAVAALAPSVMLMGVAVYLFIARYR